MGSAGVAPAVVKQLNEALNQVLNQADFREKLSSEAVELRPMSPEAFGTFVKTDIARWSKLAKERHIQLDS
jgi:tripartite-type tricarboxylate transporter receptor subunit TctC